jgi:MFS family permease
MQTVAMAWLVLQLTDSGTSVGTLTATAFAPVLLLSAWAGAVADRLDERRAVITVQSLLGVQATLLAVVVLTDVVELWMLYGLAVMQGIGIAFDTPTRQSLVGRLVGNADLHNALSLNAGLIQVARVVGPAAAGVLIETVGIGVCFAINAVSYAIISAAVFSIDVRPRAVAAGAGPRRGGVADGIRVVWSSPGLPELLLLALVVGLVGVNFTVGLPVLVRQEYGDDARIFGFLAATYGVGALVGAAFSAARHSTTKRLLVGSCVVLALGLVACAQGSHLGVVVFGVSAAGLMGLTLAVTLNASLQLGAPLEYRGRVIGLYFLVAFGSNVLGGPLVGSVAEIWGATTSFAASAAVIAAAALAFGAHWRGRLDEPIVSPA